MPNIKIFFQQTSTYTILFSKCYKERQKKSKKKTGELTDFSINPHPFMSGITLLLKIREEVRLYCL